MLRCTVQQPVCPCVALFSKFHEPDTHGLLRATRYSIFVYNSLYTRPIFSWHACMFTTSLQQCHEETASVEFKLNATRVRYDDREPCTKRICGCSSWAREVTTEVWDAWHAVRGQTYGYLPNRRAVNVRCTACVLFLIVSVLAYHTVKFLSFSFLCATTYGE